MEGRFSEVEGSINERSLEERLKDYPELKAKIEALLGIIENAGGDIEKAAEAEQRIIDEIRHMALNASASMHVTQSGLPLQRSGLWRRSALRDACNPFRLRIRRRRPKGSASSATFIGWAASMALI
jgi:hypothetical protein